MYIEKYSRTRNKMYNLKQRTEKNILQKKIDKDKRKYVDRWLTLLTSNI
jgi:hypothetical protein